VEVVLHLKTWFQQAETDAEKARLTETLRLIVGNMLEECEHNEEINASAVSICQHEILNLLADPKLHAHTRDYLKMLVNIITVCSPEKYPDNDNQNVVARMLNKTVLRVIEV
jgi:hypothetical protein